MARYGERTRLISSDSTQKNIGAWFGQAPPVIPTVDLLIIAGGGSGSYGSYAGAGGGAGGYLEYASQVLETGASYTVTVGAGGSAPGGNAIGNNGNNSVFGSLSAAIAGGGAGGGTSGAANNGRAGGSGGGGATNDTSGGGVTVGGAGTAGPPRQGYNGGGNGNFTAAPYPSGGGGGAGGVGATASGASTSGNGGIGTYTTFGNDIGLATTSGQLSGGNYYYAGGGGGANHLSGTSGTGGLGGGGNGGQYNSSAGVSGTANTGGGGGSGTNNTTAGAGGSGLVVARYLGDPKAYGGTITSSGGYTYHKFTSSSLFYNSRSLPVGGASLWLDASDAATLSLSGSNVNGWLDKSGNIHLFSAPSGKEPLYVTNLQNGLPGIRFFPSSAVKYLTNTSLGNWSATPFTAFFVFNSSSSGANYPALLGRNTLGAFQMGGNNAGPSALSISKIGSATQNSSLLYTGTTADVGVYKATAASSTSVTVQTYKNGTAASATVTQGSLTSTGDKNTIGASVDGTGDSMAPLAYLCEIILYTSALSDTDRNSVENYLKAKWGTP
jgi:hypothetical protein